MNRSTSKFRTLSFVICIFFFVSCYKEVLQYPDTKEGFDFQVTPYQEYLIRRTRQNLSFQDTLPLLHLDGKDYYIDRFEIRGENSLQFKRKAFSINMDNKLTFFIDEENRPREFEKIKLISLVYDYTYIENCLAIGLSKEVDLWPTFSFYTEVSLNDHTQGVYLFIEDPEEYFLYQLDASFIIRRHYDHQYKKYEANELRETHPPDYYLAKYDSIYSYIGEYRGRELFDSLSHLIDLPQYFSKLAIDLLVQNGDATDEIYLYTKWVDGREIFGVYPWDLDDLFEEFPHEIGRGWASGSVFGTRIYNSMDDVIADVGEKLLFSIEDDLDYIIARDEFLYGQYLNNLRIVMSKITPDIIEAIVLSVHNQIQPFYDVDEIIEQSRYDQDSTNQQLFDINLADKRQRLLDRRAWIVQELSEVKK
jgi:spore coat protein H